MGTAGNPLPEVAWNPGGNSGRAILSVVFLSYDRNSRALAEALAKDMDGFGHSVWFDKELAGGQPWWDEILDRIRTADIFVYALTPRSVASVACQREHEYACALGKAILPVSVADQLRTDYLPPALALLQVVDYSKPDKEAAIRLIRAFGALPPARALPNPLPNPPEAPTSYLGTLAQRVNAAVLTYEEQGAIVFEVKRSLEDPETGDEARNLLKRLRKRRDLFAPIAQEIDALQALPAKPIAKREQPAAQPKRPLTAESEGDDDWAMALFVCGVIGAVLCVVSLVVGGEGELFFLGLIWGALGGGVAGRLAGSRSMPLFTAIIGAGAAYALTGYGSFWNLHDTAIFGVVFGPIGAVLGAMVGSYFLFLDRSDRAPMGFALLGGSAAIFAVVTYGHWASHEYIAWAAGLGLPGGAIVGGLACLLYLNKRSARSREE